MQFDKLTLFYNKRTSIIKELCTGEQDMNWFGEEKQDYEQIFDYIIVDYDGYIMQSPHHFIVKNGKLNIKEDFIPTKYL
ncbi:hypothetical protein NSA47_02305 [Irregularibacter muris]|uniref:Uncharacterized protein n=1 Tax=Irregularibacter muris TaxID=1796619 RepID=A0AAE3HCP9_9FIRM|nr:hypothetical protein [Irregularibacter muris]MCR1897820.1 hypothetical protein [Irregularibacter muris]